MTEKLQKVLARAGIGSRRQMEDWIAAGRVSIDGVRAPLGERVDGSETIRVDGHVIATRLLAGSKRRILLYNKPEREMCTRSDPEGRPTVFDRLPPTGGSRWISVGRLDFNTMGLLILTTDGELAHRIAHPSFGMEREYAVRVLGEMSDEALKTLQKGVDLEDGPAQFLRIVEAGGEGANHWYRVVLGEGRNREVRRMFEAVDVTVSRLIRVRYGKIELPRGIQRGRWEEMDTAWVRSLAASVGLTDAPPPKGRAAARSEGGKRPSRGRSKPHAGAAPAADADGASSGAASGPYGKAPARGRAKGRVQDRDSADNKPSVYGRQRKPAPGGRGDRNRGR
jgi:23S rRNA pseudouridine2605 synthase